MTDFRLSKIMYKIYTVLLMWEKKLLFINKPLIRNLVLLLLTNIKILKIKYT